ncbi:MAG: hypothetical protein WKF28_09250 [Rubrobacteraceae bacterium]
MNRIIFPLEAGRQGPEVADLHAALQLLLDRGAILRDDEGARRELSAELERERAERVYGDATIKVVAIFRKSVASSPAVTWTGRRRTRSTPSCRNGGCWISTPKSARWS